MNWNDWLRDGRIEVHSPARDEIVAQRRVAERSLTDAALPGLSPEGRFQLAYDAMLALATLAVLASGHRVRSRFGHHQVTIAASGVAIGSGSFTLIRYFDLCRRTRDVISYEGDEIGQEQANELLAETTRFGGIVDAWLSEKHPTLA